MSNTDENDDNNDNNSNSNKNENNERKTLDDYMEEFQAKKMNENEMENKAIKP